MFKEMKALAGALLVLSLMACGPAPASSERGAGDGGTGGGGSGSTGGGLGTSGGGLGTTGGGIGTSGGGLGTTGGGSGTTGGGIGTTGGGSGTTGGGSATNGGGGGTGGGQGTDGDSAGPPGWTILVYVVADNDLEPFSLLDLEEMASVGSNSELHIVAQVDRSSAYSTAPVLNVPNWTSTKRFLVGKNSLTEISDLGEINMADPASLRNFIKWGLQTYPSDKAALVLWDHGGGSLTGFGVDEQSTGIMGIAAVQRGISEGLAQAGRSKLDIIGFDACLMASFEVAEALKGLGRYLIGSEENEPGHGWDYTALAGVGASTTASALGRKIADTFKAQAQNPKWHDDATITLSVVDLSMLGPIETALASLATSYPNGAALTPVFASVSQGRNAALAFGDNPDPSRACNLVDLSDLFSRATGVQSAAAIQTAVRGAVLHQVTGSSTARAHGLTVYFPPERASYSGTTYDTIAALPGVAGVSDWRTFLQAYFAGGASASAPTFVEGSANYSATRSLLSIWGDVTSATQTSLTDGFLVYGLPYTDTGTGKRAAILLGDYDAQGAGNTVKGAWDWTVLQLVQGTYSELGYLSVHATSAAEGVAAIPLVYESGGNQQEAVRAIAFDLATGTIISDRTYAYSASGALGELFPLAGSRLHAKVAVLPDTAAYETRTWAWYDETGVGFDATQGVNVTFPSIKTANEQNPPPVVFSGLRIENTVRQGDWAYLEHTRPAY